MIRILHVGLSGCSNIGDQAITDCLADIFDRSDELKYSFWPLNYNVQANLNDESLPSKKRRIMSFFREIRFVKYVYEIILPALKWKYYWGFYKAAKNNDKVVIGGGNIVMDIDILFPLHLLILSVLSHLAGAKCGILVAGVGPLNTRAGKFLCGAFIRKLDFIIVRDQKSMEVAYEFAMGTPIKVLPDPVFYAKDILYADLECFAGKKVLMSVFPYGDSRVSHKSNPDHYKLYLSLMCAYYDKMVSLGYSNFSILVTDKARDFDVANDLSKMRGFSEILAPNTVGELSSSIANASFLVATRMHPAIIAASFNTPFIALAWQDKVIECLGVMDLGNHVSDIRFLNEFTKPAPLKELLTYASKSKLALLDYESSLVDYIK